MQQKALNKEQKQNHGYNENSMDFCVIYLHRPQACYSIRQSQRASLMLVTHPPFQRCNVAVLPVADSDIPDREIVA
jgi:hypothetical protein